MKNTQNTNSQKGFTIIELMIATSAFSVLLLVVLSSLVYIGRLYYKGVTEAKTQEIARTVVDRVSQTVQLSGVPVRSISVDTGTSPWTGAYCVGSKKFSYKGNVQLKTDSPGDNQSDQVLVESDDPNCLSSNDPSPANNPVELLDELMRVTDLSIRPNGSLITVSLGIAYGGDASIEGDDEEVFDIEFNRIVRCKTGAPGSEFCSVATITTTVFRKVN